MSGQSQARPRRFARACDSCHRRKVKCYWHEPACPDCVKLGIACTFTTKNPKTRRGGRPAPLNEVRSHETNVQGSSRRSTVVAGLHSRHTQDELLSRRRGRPAPSGEAQHHDTNTQGPSRRSIVVAGLHSRHTQDEQPAEGASDPTLHDIDIPPALIEEYFAKRNHYLPILDKEAFNPEATDDKSQQAISHLMVCAAFQHHSTDSSAASSALDSQAQAEKHLAHALKHLACFDDLEPEFRTIQALVLLVDCLDKARKLSHRGAFYTAAAVRLVHLLGIHNLDLQEGLSAKQRLERIRTFWCLYILDREVSFLHDLPPLLQDGEIRVIDPKKFSDDSRGLLISVDGSSVINLFTARQRLAVILGKVYKELWTFRGQYLPSHMRSDIAKQLTTSLLEWKQEWFDIGPPQALTTQWPTSASPLLVRQYLLYFMALLHATANERRIPDIIKDMAKAVRSNHHITFDPIRPALSPTVVDAARMALQVALVVRLGDLTYLIRRISPGRQSHLADASYLAGAFSPGQRISIRQTHLIDAFDLVDLPHIPNGPHIVDASKW